MAGRTDDSSCRANCGDLRQTRECLSGSGPRASFLRLHSSQWRRQTSTAAPTDWEALTCSSLAAIIPIYCRNTTDDIYTPTAHNGPQATPPTRCKATPPHKHPGNTICLLPMSTRIRCYGQRDYSRSIHRADDQRATTYLAPSSHPAALIQAS